MVAGVAHEVNNPLAFVRNNLALLQRDLGCLRELIQLYQEADESLDQSRPELLARIRALAEQMDLAYTLMHVESLATRSTEGLRRIEQIVKDLRDFARLHEAERKEIDLNESIATTVGIARLAAREQQVEIVTDLGPLCPITCYPAKFNQVVLNLLTNAIDASTQGGTVTIRTRMNPDGGVTLEVIDAGRGIDPAIRDRIFEPFFKTKSLGYLDPFGLTEATSAVAEALAIRYRREGVDSDETLGPDWVYRVAPARFMVSLVPGERARSDSRRPRPAGQDQLA
jgi:signal transduction histidine kinase